MRAISSITSISRVTSSARHVGGRAHVKPCPPLDVEAEPLEDRDRSPPRSRRAPVTSARARAQRDPAPARGGRRCTSIGSGGERRARDLDEQPRGRAVRDRGERGVDALLEPVRRLRAQPEAPASCAGSEPRRSSPPRARPSRVLVADLGVGAAHDARDARAGRRRPRSRASSGVERALLAVERASASRPAARAARSARAPRDRARGRRRAAGCRGRAST